MKQRQKIRKNILILSSIFFPVTFYYFSPYLIIDAASQGIINGSFVVFIMMFISALFIGRLYCGWLCPTGGIQQVCMTINNKKFKIGKRNWLKYFIWIPWLIIIAFMFIQAGGIKSVDPLYQTYYGISVSDIYSLILFIIIILLVAIVAIITGKRGFCHLICWMAPFMIVGRKIRNIIKYPSLRLRAEKDKCINCKTCSTNCPKSLDVNDMVKKGSMENAECVLCGTCVDNCPQGVISYSFKSGIN